MQYYDYGVDLIEALSERTGIELVGTKDINQTYPYAQYTDGRLGNQQSTGGVDFPSGGFTVNGFFKSRREGEYWGEWFRQSIISNPIKTPNAYYRITSINLRTRPDISKSSGIWRTTMIAKYERIPTKL